MIRILHVDDNPDDLELTKRKLQRLSSEVQIEWAESGNDALKALKENEYNLVICDFQMPEMNGLGFIHTLRQSGNLTPIIFFSGQGNEDITAQALRAGAEAYFVKDMRVFRYERLMRSITRVVAANARNQNNERILENSVDSNGTSSPTAKILPLSSKS